MDPKPSKRHGVYALVALFLGAGTYLLVRDPVPLLGIDPVLDVSYTWWLGSLPSAFYGVALTLALSWATRGRHHRMVLVMASVMVVGVESSQGYGPMAGWGTYDPADLFWGLSGVAIAGMWSLGVLPLTRARDGSRLRLLWVIGLAGVAAVASSADPGIAFPVPRCTVDSPVSSPSATQGQCPEIRSENVSYFSEYGLDFTVEFRAALDVSEEDLEPWDELRMEVAWDSVLPIGFDLRNVLDSGEVSQFECLREDDPPGALVECFFGIVVSPDTAPGRYELEYDLTLNLVQYVAGAPVLGDEPADYSSSLVVIVGGDAAENTSTTIGTTSATQAGSPCPAAIAEAASRSLNISSLDDSEVVNTNGGYTWDGHTMVLSADGEGSLIVGLVDADVHDPCTDGGIDNLTFDLSAQGREGDRGNVGIRPALFIDETVYVAEPMTISAGSGAAETLQLAQADFTPISGDREPLDLFTGPPLQFGVVVGISCPATSTCGTVERAVTIRSVDISINPG